MKEEDLGMTMILITVILWSTIEVSTKLINESIPPMMISYLRFIIGGIFLLPVSIIGIRKGSASRCSARDWGALFLLSALGITLTFALYHKALIWISASAVATLISMVPIFAAIFSFFLIGERITTKQAIGLLIGSAGIIMIFLSEESGSFSLVGVAIMVIAVVCFSIYAVLMKGLNRKMTARVTTPISLLVGGILTIPIALIDGATIMEPLDFRGYLLVGWLGLFGVGLAYLFYFLGLERTHIARGNSLLYLKPLMAGGLAWLLIGETMTPVRVFSILLISVSIYFVLREKAVLSGSEEN